MTTARNRTENTISLGNRRFHTIGLPQRVLVSRFPEKRVDGDYDNTSNPITSVMVFSDHRDGIGVETVSGATARSWYSTLSQRHNNHLVLQRETITTDANVLFSGTESVSWVAEIGSEVYQISSDDKLYKHDNGTGGWGSLLQTFDDVVTDVITCPLAGTSTMVVAVTSGAVEFSTDGSNWTDETDTTGIKYLAYGYRDKLWGISADGKTYFANSLAGSGTVSWTQISTLNLQFGQVTKLFVGPAPNPNDDLLYAATQVGLFVYNNVNERWVKTDLTLPFHETNGIATTVFRNTIYVNAGLAIHTYTPGDLGGRVGIMGPDRDDGLPSDNQGIIRAMQGTHTELIILIDGADTATTDDESLLMEVTDGIHGSQTINTGLGFPTVLGWDTRGWEVKWEASIAGTDVCKNMLVTNAYSSYRLWWAQGADTNYNLLPVGIENPNQVATTRRESSGSWLSPWFDAGSIHQDKTALEWHLDSTSPSTTERIQLQYALNYDNNDSAFTSLGTNERSGDSVYLMPSPVEPEGIPFRAIRAKLNFSRGSNLFATPDMRKLALVYKPTLETMWGWEVTLDLSRGAEGYTPKQQREFLFGRGPDSLANKRVMIPFTMKDDDDGTSVYWVFVANAAAAETAGFRDDAIWTVTLAEASPSVEQV